MITSPVATRLIRNHTEWQPHGYQQRSVAHLIERCAAALFLDPGLGKTAIVLEAFRQLKQMGMVNRMLVVAPLRVCQLVWEQEGRKWTQFRDLTFSLLHGPKKGERLREQTDIHLINPEGIQWLTQEYWGRADLPYDIVTIDELSKFKNARAQRSKRLRAKLSNVKYRWGLTGSPAANGYMDLFGQMLILDDGVALGRFITYYRDQFFVRGYDGFSYNLKPDGAARIEQKIAPYVLRMSADDYLTLPPLTNNIISIELSPAVRKHYNELKKEMIVSLPEGVITAANSAAVYTKLAQLANGAVYANENEYIEVHTAKLDALEDLIEELAGQPLLVGYEFQHDLARLQERFPGAPTLTGLSHKRIVELEAAWNAGEIPVMFAHPASAGHGLNLQGSGASHVCWFSRPWDLDLYDQFIRRLLRQGTTSQHIMNHALVVKDSIDEIKGEALRDKDVTQKRLLTALNAEIIRDDPGVVRIGVGDVVDFGQGRQVITADVSAPTTEDSMALKKLGFQGQQGGTATAPAGNGTVTPKGWGAPSAAAAAEGHPAQQEQEQPTKTPKGWGAPAAAAEPADEQRQQINEKLRAPEPEGDEEEQPPASARALEAFGQGVVTQLTGQGQPAESAGDTQATPTPKGWGAAAPAPAQAEPAAEEPAKTPKKSAARSRRSATEPAAPVQTRPEPVVAAEAAENVGTVESANRALPGCVRIELNGLPESAIAAALLAIAENLQTTAA